MIQLQWMSSCILIPFTLFNIISASEIYTVSRCYTDNTLPLRCPAGSIIRVFNVTYGLSDSHTCSYEEGDCSLTEQTSFGCNGKNSCDISIREKTKHYILLPRCELIGDYLRIMYECVHQRDVADLCADTRTDALATKGYVASPFLVNGNYDGASNCEYHIIGSNIKLHLITVNLSDSNDCLQIHSPISTKTYCGGGGVVENYDIAPVHTNQIRLQFSSNGEGHEGGVWIYYEMIPLPVPVVRQTVPRTTTTTTKKPTEEIVKSPRKSTTSRARVVESTPPILIDSWTDKVEDKDEGVVESTPPIPQSWTDKVEDNDEDDTDITIYNNVSAHLPASTLVTILGLIFGLFGALIVGLFIVYFIKRYRDHKKKRARRRSGNSGNEHVMWHNITNECLTDILHKHDACTEQAYSNNMVCKEVNSNSPPTVPYYKQVENSFC